VEKIRPGRKSGVRREPPSNHGDDVIPFLRGKLVALAGDAVPLLEALPAARRRRVLGDECRMVPHRGLPAVVGNHRRGETLVDERAGVIEDGVEAVSAEVFELLPAEAEARAECGLGKPQEQ
jgi:hypothetical protein